MEYEMDIPCLVMPEGRPMLPSDIQIMVKPSQVEARPDQQDVLWGWGQPPHSGAVGQRQAVHPLQQVDGVQPIRVGHEGGAG